MITYGHHRFPGKLFVVEGTDGSGKSTQLALLYQWLKAEGYPVFYSEWNSSPLVKATTRRAKKRRLFTPADVYVEQARASHGAALCGGDAD